MEMENLQKGIPENPADGQCCDSQQPPERTNSEALPGILEALIADGYTVVPISQIILDGDYFIDNNGMHCRA